MNPFRRRVTDSRNKIRVVPPPNWTSDLDRMSKNADSVELMRLELYGTKKGLGVRVFYAVLLGSGFGGWIYLEGIKYIGPSDMLAVISLSLIVGLGSAWGFYRLSVRTVDSFRLDYLMHESKRCICCGYDLSGLHREEDGCFVCPECGGAWKLYSQAEIEKLINTQSKC